MEKVVINELIDVLEQENRVYDDILRISRNKTGIIVEGKVAELENIVKLEQSLILQMSRLEGIRESMVGRLSKEFGISPSEITITSMISHIRGEQAQRLKSCQEKIINIIKDLKNANDLNSDLIKNSLEYINFSINTLTNAGDGSNNYSDSGQSLGGSNSKSLFDIKL